jgi:hypothetical protein
MARTASTSSGTTSTRSTTKRTAAAASRSSTSSGSRRSSSSQSGGSRTASSRSSASPKQQAAAKANGAQEQAASTLKTQLDDRSNQFGEQLSGTAGDVRDIAAKLRDQDNDPAARIADLAADRIDQAATYLSSNSADSLLSDVEDLARSKPWLAAGAAVVAGFAASRALSASSRKRQGGDYVDLDAGSDFDEEDAAAVYPSESARRG